jgi:hypothetical protein
MVAPRRAPRPSLAGLRLLSARLSGGQSLAPQRWRSQPGTRILRVRRPRRPARSLQRQRRTRRLRRARRARRTKQGHQAGRFGTGSVCVRGSTSSSIRPRASGKHGFIAALPETEAGMALGHEPWTLRWVGQSMAARLHAEGLSGRAAQAALERARSEIGPVAGSDGLSQGPDSPGVPCWATADTTTQGCPARWFFSPSR